MSLNSLNLEAFYACARTGNFTRAAHELHITQSALSQRIKNLEQNLGTTLFIRDKKKTRLTEWGEKLIRYCQTQDTAEREFLGQLKAAGTGELAGVVRVGAFSSAARSLVLPALGGLLNKHSGVQLRLVVRELYELTPLLRSGEIDYLISTERMDHSGLISQKLGVENNVLVQKKGYKGPEIYLDHDEEDRTTTDYFGKRNTASIQRRYLDDIYGIIDGVRLGLGRAVVPRHLVTAFKDIEVINPSKSLDVPIVFHYYDVPIRTRLHQAVIDAVSTIKVG